MKTTNLMLSSLIAVVLTACGGGSGDPPPNGQVLIAETIDIKASASGAIGQSFDGNISAISQMLSENSDVLVGTVEVVSGGPTQVQPIEETDAQVQSTIQSVVETSLGAGENTASATTRTGNSISVDPDEDEMCSDESIFSDLTLADFADCKILLSNITVELVATSEQEGMLTYKYKNQAMLRLGYGTTGESVTLDLAGLKTFLNDASIIRTGSEIKDLPTTMVGAFKMTALATNTTPGLEAGTISMEIVSPIRYTFNDDDGLTDVSIDIGTLFSITADSGTGEGSMFFDAGALIAAAPTDSGYGYINMAGVTGSADINPTNGTLVVSNFGLSKGPLSMSINNQEVIRATLGAFGFHVTPGTDMQASETIIDGNMNLSVMLNQLAGVNFGFDESIASVGLKAMAPNTTSFSIAPNGATKIGGAGPFSISVDVVDTNNVLSSELIEANSGDCFTDLVDENNELEAPSPQQCL